MSRFTWYDPPWILFVDKGRPIAILPAMRSGEVMNAEHLTRAEADDLVRRANEFGTVLRQSKPKELPPCTCSSIARMNAGDDCERHPPAPEKRSTSDG